MYEVNLCASYFASYYALPHMITGGWGHIVMNSPPILTTATPGWAIYYCFKMGMTRLAIGVAAEHREDNVAANYLWPATPIESFRDERLGRSEDRAVGPMRARAIMCDALMEILRSEPCDCTRPSAHRRGATARARLQRRADRVVLAGGQGPRRSDVDRPPAASERVRPEAPLP